MNYKNFKSIKALILVPLVTLCMMTAAHADTNSAKEPSAHMPKAEMQKGSGGSDEMMKSMKTGMEGMKMSGDTDKDFAMMMKMHHQKALDMAQMELDHGKSPEMKKMAQQIIVAQKKEIAQFDRWLDKHK